MLRRFLIRFTGNWDNPWLCRKYISNADRWLYYSGSDCAEGLMRFLTREDAELAALVAVTEDPFYLGRLVVEEH